MLKARHFAQSILSAMEDLKFALHENHIEKKLDNISCAANGISRLFDRPCKYWKQNKCHFGKKCAFRHDMSRAPMVPTVAGSTTTSSTIFPQDATDITTNSSPLLHATTPSKAKDPTPKIPSTHLTSFATIAKKKTSQQTPAC